MISEKAKQQTLTFDLIDAKVCIAALNEAVRMADSEEREAVANGKEILDRKVVIEHLSNGINLIQAIIKGSVFIINDNGAQNETN